jgi:sporulation protein YlmC with PRC-barrel domain
MRLERHVTSLPFLAVLLAATPDAQRKDARPIPAGGQGQQEAEVEQGPPFLPADTGPKAVLSGADGQPLATIQDHVVDRRSGQVLFVVLEGSQPEAKGRRALLPYGQLQYDAKERRLLLPLTPAELAQLPEFDPKALQSLGATGSTPPEKPRQDPGQQEPVPQEPVRNLLASQIARSAVQARGERLGSIDTLLLEPRRGTIALVLVQRTPSPAQGKGALVVPWQVLSRDAEGRFGLDLGLAELEQAPALEKSELAKLADEQLLEAIRRFHKLPQAPGTSG